MRLIFFMYLYQIQYILLGQKKSVRLVNPYNDPNGWRVHVHEWRINIVESHWFTTPKIERNIKSNICWLDTQS